MKALSLIYIFVFLQCFSFSQKDSSIFLNDFNFIIHLTKNKLFDEAERERENIFKNKNITQAYKDSINYFMGMNYFNEKQFVRSKKLFLEISDTPLFYYKSIYLASTIDLDKNQLDSAARILTSIEQTNNTDLNELNMFEQLGVKLLKRDYYAFDSLSNSLVFANKLLESEYSNLKNYYKIDRNIKRKSPLVAGLLSAIVPGMGKVYAGNTGQGLASFLSCGLFGAIAFENSFRLGYTHPQTLFFMGVFGAFYIGNIWGSAVSVQAIKNEKQLENKYNILVSLKLPISKFFN